jgi:hypothetical protein
LQFFGSTWKGSPDRLTPAASIPSNLP